jgi:dTDP-4-dehydrorhamnose 3,5-epimerase
MPFTFLKCEIPDVVLIKPHVLKDARGAFAETFRASDFIAAGLDLKIAQSNHITSERNALHGLHYQHAPMAQGKLIRCVAGAIFDVAVDIRTGSPTYGRWVGEGLSETSGRLLYIPEGFAHGFCTLSKSAQIVYHCTAEYSAEHAGRIRWNDPSIGIVWPVKDPILSEKDTTAPFLKDAGMRFAYCITRKNTAGS